MTPVHTGHCCHEGTIVNVSYCLFRFLQVLLFPGEPYRQSCKELRKGSKRNSHRSRGARMFVHLPGGPILRGPGYITHWLGCWDHRVTGLCSPLPGSRTWVGTGRIRAQEFSTQRSEGGRRSPQRTETPGIRMFLSGGWYTGAAQTWLRGKLKSRKPVNGVQNAGSRGGGAEPDCWAGSEGQDPRSLCPLGVPLCIDRLVVS